MYDKILEFVRAREYVSIVEIQQHFGITWGSAASYAADIAAATNGIDWLDAEKDVLILTDDTRYESMRDQLFPPEE